MKQDIKKFLRQKKLIPEVKLGSVWEYNLISHLDYLINQKKLALIEDLEEWIEDKIYPEPMGDEFYGGVNDAYEDSLSHLKKLKKKL